MFVCLFVIKINKTSEYGIIMIFRIVTDKKLVVTSNTTTNLCNLKKKCFCFSVSFIHSFIVRSFLAHPHHITTEITSL